MSHRHALRHAMAPRLAIELAPVLESSEEAVAAELRRLESEPLFHRLRDEGVVQAGAGAVARFAARRCAGRELRAAGDSAGAALDGNSAQVLLIERIGQKAFERAFLGSEPLTDVERAEVCGITEAEARTLREFVDALYVSAELSEGTPQEAPGKVYSAVAGIALEDGRPVLAFFQRDVWQTCYSIDEDRRAVVLASLDDAESDRAREMLRAIERFERRKTTLYRILEEVLAAQAQYFVTRKLGDTAVFSQADAARKLGLDPSVVNRVVSNKAVELPWGLEAPLSSLLPRRSDVLRARLQALIARHPELNDSALAAALADACGTRVSRQSVQLYRREAGIDRASNTRREVRTGRLAAA